MTLSYESQISQEKFYTVLNGAKWILEWERSTGKIRGGRVNTAFLELRVPESLVIVGDLHGDWDTFQKILYSVDSVKFLSNPNNKMIFLGDYIDRGTGSIEVLYSLMYLKSSYPDSVILMRGNHEAPLQFPFASHTLMYDLKREFHSSNSLYERVLSIFELLPLMIVIQDSLLLVHGGLPVSYIYRGSKSKIGQDLHHRRVMEEILWNDPRDTIADNHAWEKSTRTFGNHFGGEITKRWLNNFGAKVVVRGHEPCRGVKISHSDRVVTLFSSREAYPDFEPTYIKISNQELHEVQLAHDLIKYSNRLAA